MSFELKGNYLFTQRTSEIKSSVDSVVLQQSSISILMLRRYFDVNKITYGKYKWTFILNTDPWCCTFYLYDQRFHLPYTYIYIQTGRKRVFEICWIFAKCKSATHWATSGCLAGAVMENKLLNKAMIAKVPSEQPAGPQDMVNDCHKPCLMMMRCCTHYTLHYLYTSMYFK